MTEQEKQQEEVRRQEAQRKEDSRRQEGEHRRQAQRLQEERRRQESQPPENGTQRVQEPPIHESTVKTLQEKPKESEQSTIAYAQKHGVPIAPVSLTMGGSKGEGRQQAQDGKTEPAEQTPKQAAAPGKESPAMERLKAKMDGMADKVQERLKAQEQTKSHDTGHDR